MPANKEPATILHIDAYMQTPLKYKVNADNDANKWPKGLSYKDDIYDIVYASNIAGLDLVGLDL